MTEVYIEPKRSLSGPSAQFPEGQVVEDEDESPRGLLSRFFGTGVNPEPQVGCDIRVLARPTIARVVPVQRETGEKFAGLLADFDDLDRAHGSYASAYFAQIAELNQATTDSERSEVAMKICDATRGAGGGENLFVHRAVCQALGLKLGTRVLLTPLKTAEVINASNDTPVITCHGSNNEVRTVSTLVRTIYEIALRDACNIRARSASQQKKRSN